MAQRIVICSKLKVESQGLEVQPFPGDLGREIYEHVSASAWAEWRDQVQIKVINEYRLNLADPDHFQILVDQLRAFLNLDEGKQMLEIGNEGRGHGET